MAVFPATMPPTMSQPLPPDETGAGRDAAARVVLQELERRLAILDAGDEARFGPFTLFDWIVSVLGFVVAPVLLVWWGAS